MSSDNSLMNTYLSISRNFLSTIRTTAIFIGLSLTSIKFIQKGGVTTGLIFLLMTICTNLYISYYNFILIRNMPKFNLVGDNQSIYSSRLKYSPLIYSIMLLIFEIIIFVEIIKNYKYYYNMN